MVPARAFPILSLLLNIQECEQDGVNNLQTSWRNFEVCWVFLANNTEGFSMEFSDWRLR